jgi:sulfite exporter TauE/SafE
LHTRGGPLAGAGAYLGGRLIGYTATGLAAGALGHAITPAAALPAVRLAAQILVAASLVITGVRWLSRRAAEGVHVETARLTWMRRARPWASRAISAIARVMPKTPLGLGLATALFPCGALAGALLIAATSGSAPAGGAAMAAFAFASAPTLAVLAGLGGGTGRWLTARSPSFRRIAGAALIAVGVATFVLGAGVPMAHRAHTCSCETKNR